MTRHLTRVLPRGYEDLSVTPEFYCPCALACHRDKHPCSFGCVAHDYAALAFLTRGSPKPRSTSEEGREA